MKDTREIESKEQTARKELQGFRKRCKPLERDQSIFKTRSKPLERDFEKFNRDSRN